jgi:hypothetical protein
MEVILEFQWYFVTTALMVTYYVGKAVGMTEMKNDVLDIVLNKEKIKTKAVNFFIKKEA